MKIQEITEKIQPAKLLAVSKLQPVQKIRELYTQGQRRFGENYVQEALLKQQALANLPDIEWHLIGHLQRKKVKQVVGKFYLIHSVDSVELAQALSQFCQQQNIIQKILLQVNIAGQASKEGFQKETLLKQWDSIVKMPNLKIMGLMTMPPLTEMGAEVRLYFAELRLLLELLRKATDITAHPLTELSMGTSHDYKVAVEEGATIVRLGTILFGERPARE